MSLVNPPPVMYGDVVTTSVSKVLGANVRTLRLSAGCTLDQFAAAARVHGLPWSSGRVGSLESGNVPIGVETLYAIATALGALIGRDVTLAELLTTREPVRINGMITVRPSALSAAMSGQPVKLSARLSGGGTLSARAEVSREADQRVCKQLGVDTATGAAAMVKLWGHVFSAERDRRAGPDANAQRRGIVARALKAELQKALTSGDD